MHKSSFKYKLNHIFTSINIRNQLVLIVLFIISLILCLNIGLGTIFLPKVYLNEKIDNLNQIYNEINNLSEKNILDSLSESKIEKLSARYSTNIYLFKLNNSENTLELIYPTLIEKNLGNNVVKKAIDYYIQGLIEETEGERTNLYKFEGEEVQERVVSNGNFKIYKIFDKSVESHYLELIGYFNGENIVYLRSNLDSMEKSIKLSNNFLLFTCLISIIIGLFLVLVIARNFTKPIVRLSKVAKSISLCRFEDSYQSDRKDEIGELTNSIFELSNELKHTIQELKEANITLTRDLKQKEEIDEMRKEFISNISHELKTPISIIQGYTEGLQDCIYEENKKSESSDNEMQDFYCEVILDETSKMNLMVKRLLLLNELEFGKSTISIEQFNLTELIQSILTTNKLKFEQQNVLLKFNKIEDCFIFSDEILIEGVLTNFITNALNHIKYDNLLKIDMIKEHDKIKISVFNSGDCIPKESLEKLWIKFYKVDKARTREYGGNGIGLSIVKASMELLKEEYGVINHENGVEFYIKLHIK